MVWHEKKHPEHEGSVVALLDDQDERTGTGCWRELYHPDGRAVPRPMPISWIQVACECG